jgi:transcriptional regulator with XRE-family HTH domain
MGAYERGFRTLSLPRLYEVAAFLGVPVSVLLGLDEAAAPSDKTPRLIFDLQALGTNRVTDLITDLIGDAHEPDERVGIGPLRSFVRSIAAQRGDWNGRILTLRGERDIAAVMVFVGAPDAAAAFAQLKAWGVLIEQP